MRSSSHRKMSQLDSVQVHIDAQRVSLAERIGLALLRRILTRIAVGQLTVSTPDGATLTRAAEVAGPSATLRLRRWRLLTRLLMRGDIGFAESYFDGDWSSPDLAALIELAARNRSALDATISGSRLGRFAHRAFHLLRANTRRGSRRNIVAHYDLGNAFYRSWLDRSMTYSSAIFETASDTLEAAQTRKLDAIVDALDLQGGERVLEIGCGWGALAERLARRGCQVTALTLSPSQHAYATERIAAAQLSGSVEIRLQDYRDVEGSYDRIVSIEMFEAVGEAFWITYFSQLAMRLAPGGLAVLQIITIEASRFDDYRRGVDFIQRYVFPGGMLPTPQIVAQLAADASLESLDQRQFGASYALTLNAWHQRFQQAWPTLQTQRFDERFKRLWEYYLKYCEGGFAAGAIDVGLYRLAARACGA
ncbi:MAG: class I SAM-dependent methyltransferase [Janthinobacterium lividum]